MDEEIIRSLMPQPVGTKTQEQEEMATGPKNPAERGGRFPKFYRHEVDEIRKSHEKHSVVAEQYGVSVETIKRVREVGRYINERYIPRDEIDRRPLYRDKHRDKPKAPKKAVTPQGNAPAGRKGRPFKSGRADLTDLEKQMIAKDIRSARQVAEAHQISVPYVKKLRREMGVSHVRTGPLSHRTVRDIHQDKKPLQQIAEERHLPVQIVRAIKEGSFMDKLKGDT